ncbi:MAG: hypothetical protein ABDH19_07150 [Thermodesulfovibrio sp.]
MKRFIWLMSVYVIKHNEYFNRGKTQGLAYKKVVLAVAHKLLRIIYAMLKSKTFFKVKLSKITYM